jgi:hypothetical protein
MAKRKSLTIAGSKSGKPRKRTVVLSARNDKRLSVKAALRDVNRSVILNEVLDVALAGVLASAPGCEDAEMKATA